MKILFISIVFLFLPLLWVTADWPVPKSIKCDSSGTFHCKTAGKYEDPFDSTCSRYFLCNEFKYETVEVALTCPENTFYDPVNEYCSSQYKCICDDDIISTTILPSKTRTPANDCKICLQCISSVNTDSTTGSTMWSTYPSKAATSHTTVKEDNISTTREFINTIESTLSTTLLTNDTTWMTPKATSSPSSFTTEKYETTLTAINPTSDSTITAATHKYCYNEGGFACRRTGRFANPNDSSCNSYFYCYVWSDGRVSQYLYSCSIGLFNPIKRVCDISYICHCLENSSTKTLFTSTIKDQSPSTRSEPNSGTTFFSTTEEELTSINPHSVTETRPISTNKEQPFPSSSYSTMENISNTTRLPSFVTTQSPYSANSSLTTPEYCNLERNFTCTKSGRFLNPNDPSCNSYFYCYIWFNGEAKQYLYSCSVGLFNPTKATCDVSYACPCIENNTTEAFSSTTKQLPSSTIRQSSSATLTSITELSTGSSEPPENCNSKGNFTCLTTGRFANPNDLLCNSYFYCYVWSDGAVGQYLYSCSIGVFNPSKGACDLTYECPCLTANITETAAISMTIQLPSSLSTQVFNTTESTDDSMRSPTYCNLGENFTCAVTGRFANPNDSSCNSYFYCYILSSDKVGQHLYTCSTGLFNPIKGACDTSYICPCTKTNKLWTPSTISSNL